jgi:type IV secretion system protein VirB10
MSQSTPPNMPPESDGSNNPYYQRQAPDLDASTPILKDEEQQRLNRKAMFFLAATLAVVIAIAVLVLTAGGGDERPVAQTRSERIEVPDVPRSVTAQRPDPPPIPVLPDEPEPPPPLPAREAAPGERTARPDPRVEVMRRRIADAGGLESGGQGAAPGVSADPSQGSSAVAASAAARPRKLGNPDGTMTRGTYLRCVLETRIISDLDGFASCVVTEPVYSFNGRNLLLPKGSKIFGRYAAGDFTNNRMAVVWDRVLTPAGIDVTLSAPGVDNLGSSGMPGQYSAHWARRISSALMISLLSDVFKYYAAENGPSQTGLTSGGFVTQEPFESNTAESIQSLAEQAIRENSRRPPTVTLNQGTVVNIYVTQDIDFSNVLAMN